MALGKGASSMGQSHCLALSCSCAFADLAAYRSCSGASAVDSLSAGVLSVNVQPVMGHVDRPRVVEALDREQGVCMKAPPALCGSGTGHVARHLRALHGEARCLARRRSQCTTATVVLDGA